jgi:hypothetical protein
MCGSAMRRGGAGFELKRTASVSVSVSVSFPSHHITFRVRGSLLRDEGSGYGVTSGLPGVSMRLNHGSLSRHSRAVKDDGMWDRREDAGGRRSGAIMHVARSRAGWVFRDRQNSRRARGQGR